MREAFTIMEPPTSHTKSWILLSITQTKRANGYLMDISDRFAMSHEFEWVYTNSLIR